MITYIQHAIDMLAERTVDSAWVERTLLAPKSVEPYPTHPGRFRAFRAVPERDSKVCAWGFLSRQRALMRS